MPGTSQYPTTLDTLADLLEVANRANSTLSSGISDSDTSLTLASTSLFPSSGAVSIDNEIIYYTGKSTNTLTGLIRGRDGTSAAAHSSGAAVSMRVVAAHHKVHSDAIIAIETKWPGSVTGIVASNGTSPAVGRTITGTNNKITVADGSGVSGNPTITIPDLVTLVTPTVSGLLSVRTTDKSIASLENALESRIALSGETDYTAIGFQRGTSGVAAATGTPLVNIQFHHKPNAAAGVTVPSFLISSTRYGTGSTPTANGAAEAHYQFLSVIIDKSDASSLAGQHDSVGVAGYVVIDTGSNGRAYPLYGHAILKTTTGNALGAELVVENMSGTDSPLTAVANRTVLLGLTSAGNNKNGIGILFNSSNGATSALKTGIHFNANSIVSTGYGVDFAALGTSIAAPIRLANNSLIKARNAADSADVEVIGLSGTNAVTIAPGGGATVFGGTIATTGIAVGGGTTLTTTNQTGSGSLVLATSPTIVTPTIASFANAPHNHTNAAGGGVLPIGALPVLDGARVFNSGAFSAANGFSTVTFDSERYDTNSLHSTSSNTSRLTAQVAGKYVISGHVVFTGSASGTQRIVRIRLNGTTYIAANEGAVSTTDRELTVSTIYQLAATDYVELVVFQDTGGALNIKATANYSPEFAMQMISV